MITFVKFLALLHNWRSTQSLFYNGIKRIKIGKFFCYGLWHKFKKNLLKPFQKILIANRGEIARRIIRTCRRLNLQTVAIHTDIDFHCPFVAEASEHYCLGPNAESAHSYLDVDRLVQLCQQLKVDAVHPGYGFLSENVRFCSALEEAGICFIGPNSSAIRAMGDKIESKRLAVLCGVNVIEGIVQEISDLDRCLDQATEIGYPVMIKASAGGGGKGMRVCRSKEDIRSCFEMVRQEAQNAFGDHRIFMGQSKMISDEIQKH